MKRQVLGGVMDAPRIALGCWRTAKLSQEEMTRLLETALDEGVDFFDTADIYGGGKSEELLGAAINALGVREKVTVQTKCAIHDGIYDFSYGHIISSVEKSLKRLNMDYIDVLLLHRPDTLMEPEEVAEAFDRLQSSGKVREFGVSNQSPQQMALLERWLRQRLLANQLQFSLTNSSMIDCGINVNMEYEPAVNRDGGVLEYCRLHDITIQAWSPLQYGIFEGTFLDNGEKFPELNACLAKYAAEKGVTKAAVAFAWILRHPAKIQVIAGTTDGTHLREVCRGADVSLTRAEWYELYKSAGNRLP